MLSTIDICGAEMWTLRKIDTKCFDSVESWCWRNLVVRDQKISWTETVKKEEVSQTQSRREHST